MKNINLNRLILVPILLLASCSSIEKKTKSIHLNQNGFNVQLKKITLDNGLKIILIPDSTAPVISYQTWVKTGSVNEKFGQTGVAHLFEHLLFKGTLLNGERPFFKKLESQGAVVNAYTTRDYTVYYNFFEKSLLELVVDLESDRFANTIFTEADLFSEKNIVLDERKLRLENSPAAKIDEATWKLAYKVHPYANPIIGEVDDIISLQFSELRNFFLEHYHPSRITVIISGDIDVSATEKLVRSKYTERYLATLNTFQKENQLPLELEPLQTSKRTKTIQLNIEHPILSIAFPITAANHPDTHALDVLNSILFDGRHSRLQRKLVREIEVAQNISGLAFTPLYPGLFLMTAVPRIGTKIEILEKEIMDEIKKIQKQGVTQEEVNVAITQLIFQLVDQDRSQQGIANLVGLIMTVFDDPRELQRELERYQNVTPKKVQQVAQKYLNENSMNSVYAIPFQEKE